jgi:hypothetical protein
MVDPADASSGRERGVAGALLVVGSVIFYAAVALIVSIADPGGRSIVSLTDEARLAVLAANTQRWELGWMFGIAGIVVTTLGLVLFEALLRAGGDRILARLAVTTFVFGAILTVAARAREVSVTLWAAAQTATGAPVPALLTPTGDWANAMTAIYTALAFASIALFGASILITGLITRWIGWAAVAWGIGWGLLFVVAWFSTGGFDYPVLHHVIPLLIGVALLRGSALLRQQGPTSGQAEHD